jgi:16S rRNA (guanine(966)-N(2))-methyltransferase RsmD
MRIIAGEFRSRKLKSVPGLDVRPTPDRMRESLFNILAPRLAGTVFVDAYAGSGAVGLEAFSRGAKRVILIEKKQGALEVIRENVATLGIGKESVSVVRGQASLLLANFPADIVFLDPPYELEAEYPSCLNILADMPCEIAIAQHPSRLTLAEEYGRLRKTRVVKQGDNSLSFYS